MEQDETVKTLLLAAEGKSEMGRIGNKSKRWAVQNWFEVYQGSEKEGKNKRATSYMSNN